MNDLVIEKISVKSLKPFPGNARRGDIDEVAASLQAHGQFRPILVQKSSNQVIAGNHTLAAAKKLGWKQIDITYLDVDDIQAKKINLIDNRTSDLGSYDYDALLAQMNELPDLEGTGYPIDLLEQILADAENDSLAYENIGAGAVGRSAFDEDADYSDVDDFEMLPSVLPGVADLKADVLFESDDWWGMPDYLPQMLCPRLEQVVDTWSGPTTTILDDESLYCYTFGTDSVKGIPWDRTILSFFTSDARFENWWAEPAKYVARVKNSGIHAVITHDFSLLPGIPRLLQHFNVYRTRWLGRYMQECGIRIIPHLQYVDMSSFDFCLDGIPKNLPILADQMQTQTEVKEDPKERELRQRCLNYAVEELQPQQLLIYGNQEGFDIVAELELDCEVIYVENRVIRRNRWQKERDKAVNTAPALRRKASRVSGVPQFGVTNQNKP